MLEAVRQQFPEIYRLVYQAYGEFSYLSYGKNTILSDEGIQQGDPLGPLLFSLTIHPLVESMESGLNEWFLDDSNLLDDAAIHTRPCRGRFINSHTTVARVLIQLATHQ